MARKWPQEAPGSLLHGKVAQGPSLALREGSGGLPEHSGRGCKVSLDACERERRPPSCHFGSRHVITGFYNHREAYLRNPGQGPRSSRDVRGPWASRCSSITVKARDFSDAVEG